MGFQFETALFVLGFLELGTCQGFVSFLFNFPEFHVVFEVAVGGGDGFEEGAMDHFQGEFDEVNGAL